MMYYPPSGGGKVAGRVAGGIFVVGGRVVMGGAVVVDGGSVEVGVIVVVGCVVRVVVGGVVWLAFIVVVTGVKVTAGLGFIARLTLNTKLITAAAITGEVIAKLFISVPSGIFLPPKYIGLNLVKKVCFVR